MAFAIRRLHITLVFTIFMCSIILINCNKEIPVTRFSQNNVNGPTMTFFYCYSCGYRKAFDEYAMIIQEKYPEIQVNGGNYDPPGMNMYLSKIILIFKLFMIIAIMQPYDIFNYFGQQIPGWWRWCTENKLYAGMMIFFVGNMLEAQLISSGAFEIQFNDVPVWSKIQSGRIPAPQELFQIIDSHLQFSENSVNSNPDFVK